MFSCRKETINISKSVFYPRRMIFPISIEYFLCYATSIPLIHYFTGGFFFMLSITFYQKKEEFHFFAHITHL